MTTATRHIVFKLCLGFVHVLGGLYRHTLWSPKGEETNCFQQPEAHQHHPDRGVRSRVYYGV